MKTSFKEFLKEKEEEVMNQEADEVITKIKDFIKRVDSLKDENIHTFAKDELEMGESEVEEMIYQLLKDYVTAEDQTDDVSEVDGVDLDVSADEGYDETIDKDVIVDEEDESGLDVDPEQSFNKGNPKKAEIIKATFDGKDFSVIGKSTPGILSDAERKKVTTVVLTKINRDGDTVLNRYDWDENSDDFIMSKKTVTS